MWLTVGRNSHGAPAESAPTNSTRIVRSTSTFSVTCCASLDVRPPSPVIAQKTSYSGTSANPKQNMPAQSAASFSVRTRFGLIAKPSEQALHRAEHDEADVERGREQREQHGVAARAHTALVDAARIIRTPLVVAMRGRHHV